MCRRCRSPELLRGREGGTSVNGCLVNGETERETEIKNFLAAVLIGGAGHAASSDCGFKVVVVVFFEESFDLAGEEFEQFLV